MAFVPFKQFYAVLVSTNQTFLFLQNWLIMVIYNEETTKIGAISHSSTLMEIYKQFYGHNFEEVERPYWFGLGLNFYLSNISRSRCK